MEIGTRIKKARLNAGFTQEQSAETLGVSRQTISNWENGGNHQGFPLNCDHSLKIAA